MVVMMKTPCDWSKVHALELLEAGGGQLVVVVHTASTNRVPLGWFDCGFEPSK